VLSALNILFLRLWSWVLFFYHLQNWFLLKIKKKWIKICKYLITMWCCKVLCLFKKKYIKKIRLIASNISYKKIYKNVLNLRFINLFDEQHYESRTIIGCECDTCFKLDVCWSCCISGWGLVCCLNSSKYTYFDLLLYMKN
jgi:hypothetical protein